MEDTTHLFTFNELKEYSAGTWKNISDNTNKTVRHITTDTRSDCSNSLFLALRGVNFDAHDFLDNAVNSGATALCLEKGRYDTDSLPDNLPILEVNNTLKAYQDIAKNYRATLNDLTLIAVTGSNGKTSTKEILKGILSQEFGEDAVYATRANTNNQIGTPLNILNINPRHKYAVIELGTNHPGELDVIASIAMPDIAIITSIASSHLEFFINLHGVAEEKSNILNHFHKSKRENLVVLPSNILKYKPIRDKLNNIRYMTYNNTDSPSDITYNYISTDLETTSYSLSWHDCFDDNLVRWSIPGKHQIANAAAAATAASFLGIQNKDVCRHLTKCKLSGMRMKINRINNTHWINDAYNANPDSTKAGLEYISDILVTGKFKTSYIILGDMLELGENAVKSHYETIRYAQYLHPDAIIILIGDFMKKAFSQIKFEASDKTEIIHLANIEEASEYLISNIGENDMVYLKGSRGMKLESIEKYYLENSE
ncbi:MAG TPA: UDP-N-acetylmuramoyl-tripeptide--D-alanyl-D-alanine ligase [Victivallales bacterium]|nr:UDP-N-acetylmuramoyl-tripeptide--D-alanyl-D-alanine ligase [Victivallales bacterium]